LTGWSSENRAAAKRRKAGDNSEDEGQCEVKEWHALYLVFMPVTSSLPPRARKRTERGVLAKRTKGAKVAKEIEIFAAFASFVRFARLFVRHVFVGRKFRQNICLSGYGSVPNFRGRRFTL
jgi:hypothetical protein